jgi:hypothetical protein
MIDLLDIVVVSGSEEAVVLVVLDEVVVVSGSEEAVVLVVLDDVVVVSVVVLAKGQIESFFFNLYVIYYTVFRFWSVNVTVIF